jgi:sterol desaturase/sphingolipid hydroxylase (fatty acid hydroxylase superfamily)
VADFIINEESTFRLAVFGFTLVLMSAWEWAVPKRGRTYTRRERWFGNLGLIAVDSLFLRLILSVVAVDVAVMCAQKGWGLFNVLSWPPLAEGVLAIILLDLVIYWQHRLFHKVPLFWRLHQVHHTDRDLDATSALRFHPIEIILSMLIKMAAVVILGPAMLAVIVFEVILNAMALFNHANVRLPKAIEPHLRFLVVTPDMHRIHHSEIPKEFNSNFGFNLSVWDRMFSSYIQEPAHGQISMSLGQKDYRTDETRSLLFMLMLPFRKQLK